MTRRQGFMQAGDALRALAAMMIVAYHVLLGAALATGGPAARHVPTRRAHARCVRLAAGDDRRAT